MRQPFGSVGLYSDTLPFHSHKWLGADEDQFKGGQSPVVSGTKNVDLAYELENFDKWENS